MKDGHSQLVSKKQDYFNLPQNHKRDIRLVNYVLTLLAIFQIQTFAYNKFNHECVFTNKKDRLQKFHGRLILVSKRLECHEFCFLTTLCQVRIIFVLK